MAAVASNPAAGAAPRTIFTPVDSFGFAALPSAVAIRSSSTYLRASTSTTRGSKLTPASEAFPERGRPAYTTVQTVVCRLERKKAVRLVKRIRNANIFEAAISRNDAQRRVIDDLLGLFGGRGKPVMAHLIESGSVSLEDLKEAERELRRLSKKEKSQ